MPTTYYLDDSDTRVYAAIGDMADGGLFQISVSPPDEAGRWQTSSAWRFLVHNSLPRDAAHQRIYGTHRVMVLDAREVEALPEVPPIPAHEPVNWVDNFRPSAAVSRNDYRELAAYIEQRTLRRASHAIDVHLVLAEDSYESMFGDGKFLDLDQAFPENHWQASDCIARGKQGFRLELRRATVHLENECLSLVCMERGAFDHWHDREVFAALERYLDPATAPSPSDPDNISPSRIILP